MMNFSQKHIPVLLTEILNFLIDKNSRSIFDGTLGLGGHAEKILEKYEEIIKYFGFDLDLEHLKIAEKNLSKFKKKSVFFNENFVQISDKISTENPPRPLIILLDLGVCSNHLDNAEKGFAFSVNAPLKMSFAGKNEAENLLNTASEKEIRDVLKNFGEEPNHFKLAKKIVEFREKESLKTTFQLKEIIEKNTHPKDYKKTLTRVFQAIRIAVNDELNILQKTLETCSEKMESGDRIGVISYHSLEDRIVKKFFAKKSKNETKPDNFSLHSVIKIAEFHNLTRKAMVPTSVEISQNARSRSAKFRILEKK